MVLQERGAGLFQGVAGVSGVGPRPRRSGTALGRWRRVAHIRIPPPGVWAGLASQGHPDVCPQTCAVWKSRAS